MCYWSLTDDSALQYMSVWALWGRTVASIAYQLRGSLSPRQSCFSSSAFPFKTVFCSAIITRLTRRGVESFSGWRSTNYIVERLSWTISFYTTIFLLITSRFHMRQCFFTYWYKTSFPAADIYCTLVGRLSQILRLCDAWDLKYFTYCEFVCLGKRMPWFWNALSSSSKNTEEEKVAKNTKWWSKCKTVG